MSSSTGEKRMMKRSDFAQKLLDDLRVRKEQLSVSENSVYSYRGFMGSKETRTKSTTFQDLNYGGPKSVIEASKQIVAYGNGKGRSMEKIDLSKALAFALENAGKATRADPCGNASVIRFLHEVGKRSLEYGTAERRSIQQQPCSSSTQQSPMIHVHIKEISKGTQKLNKIIKACSNGLSFRKGRYSIQCGEDLMEGAIELEQSLRLLVDIQQASSEYITKKQNRNQIKLLEEHEEEEDAPYQSYETSRQVAKADIGMKLLALSYPRDKNNKHRKQSSSCDNTEQRSLKPHKGRIPSVVAKLMGLGEFPENEKESKRHNDASIKSAERVIQANENLVDLKAQRNLTSLDLVIHKETHTGHDTNHKAKSQRKEDREKDGTNIRKRNMGFYKKDGEITKRNISRRISSPTEDKHKVVARSKHKSLHNCEGGGDKKSVEKVKLQRERQKVDGLTNNLSPKSPSVGDIQTKLQLTSKAKALRKRFSQVEVAQKEKEGEGHKAEILEMKSQDISIPNGRSCRATEPPEKMRSNCKEADERHDKLLRTYKQSIEMKTETGTCINSPPISELEVQVTNRNGIEKRREIKDDSILLITSERVLGQAPPEKYHGIMLTDVMDQQAPMPKSDGESKTVYKGTKGEVETDLALLENRLEHRKAEKKEILSESETNIKKIVLKSQLFLDTAEALYKLSIPLNEGSESNYKQEEKNLILDCGYELMKRKGRFQELSVHPFVKAPTISSKVNSLDDLVRQLNKEFEKLRVYGRDFYVEDYLPKVLERDVHHKDPNLNSMWDMGWNDLMLAFIEKDDVIRDIEREIFSGLLEEITRDLICI